MSGATGATEHQSVLRLRVLLVGIASLATSCGSVTTEPTPAPVHSTAPTVPASPSASVAPTTLDHDLVYFARDRLPPVAVHIDGAGQGSTAQARILARLTALFAARPAAAGLFNAAAAAKARPRAVTIAGDVATVDFAVPGGDWGTAGSAGTRAFIQQVIYTASEEPGIRRVLLLENGGAAVIGGEGVVIDHAAARDDLLGYTTRPSTDAVRFAADRSGPLAVSGAVSLEETAPALTRLTVTAPDATAKDTLGFTARVSSNDEVAAPELGKWALVVDVPKATATDTGLRIVDRTPVRAIRTTARGDGVRYELGLDDLRPWRVAMRYAPLRLVVDVGGDPLATSANIALYAPQFGSTVRAGDSVSGLIRAFEARFEYRIRDARGIVVVDDFATASLGTSELWGEFRIPFPRVATGRATLEILLRSPRDGSVSEMTSTAVEVAGTP